MKTSFTFKLLHLALKLKGIKKSFSTDPIDYKKIRKEDVFFPSRFYSSSPLVHRFAILDSMVTEIRSKKKSKQLVIFIHGGAFISGPSQHHWDTMKKIYHKTDQTLWLCNYPKAPENKLTEIFQNIDAIYEHALGKFEAHEISIMGDSAGGNLVLSLTQRLIKNGFALPRRLLLISPVADASFENPAILPLDKTDPILGREGVLSAKKMVAGNIDIKDERISPLYGDFKGFPETYLFLSENDICFPDGMLLSEKMNQQQVRCHSIIGRGMPHIWPLLPVMQEAKEALQNIIEILKEN